MSVVHTMNQMDVGSLRRQFSALYRSVNCLTQTPMHEYMSEKIQVLISIIQLSNAIGGGGVWMEK